MAEDGASREGMSEGADAPRAGEHERFPRPGPDSPFYQPPPSDQRLRRSVPILIATPLLIAAIPITAGIVKHNWAAVGVGVVILLWFGSTRLIMVRTIRRELAARRAGQPPQEATWPIRAPGVAYVVVVTVLLVGATVFEFAIGVARWGEHGSADVGLGILGVVPSLFTVWVLVTLLRRRRAGRRE